MNHAVYPVIVVCRNSIYHYITPFPLHAGMHAQASLKQKPGEDARDDDILIQFEDVIIAGIKQTTTFEYPRNR